jgi:hypothetical protein
MMHALSREGCAGNVVFRRDGRVGRRRSPAKGVWGQKPHRGFESLSLRI